ncbi:MAG: hypothetical protein HYZ75_13785 [Elusimicrobia bacterium]|nr:hypothetical protein [Elusimicrobiota bacterium]
MKAKLLPALLATLVVTGSAFGAGKAVEALPEGVVRDAGERWILEPGRELAERVGDSRAVRKARKKAARRLEDAAERAGDALEDAGVADADRVAALYTTGAWAAAGFVVCLLAAMALGVSSLMSALALGLKVSLAFFFLQGALVCGAVFLVGRQ